MNKMLVDRAVADFKHDLEKCHFLNIRLIKLNADLEKMKDGYFNTEGEENIKSFTIPDTEYLKQIEDIQREIFTLRQHFTKVKLILSRLDPQIRQALIYRYIYEMKVNEVAQVLELHRLVLYRKIERELSNYFVTLYDR